MENKFGNNGNRNPGGHQPNRPPQQNDRPQQSQPKPESRIPQTKSPVKAGWDNFIDFIKVAFIKTPFETVFELLLLIAGATRTLDLMNTMGQSGAAAVIGLIYAELGIVLYEFLMYRGKRVKKEKRTIRGEVYKAYPLINQKSLAKIGLWVVHIPLTVFFTTSDLIMTNLEAMTGNSNFTSTFAWILGLVIGVAFFLDLILVINYKAKDPEKEHAEAMSQLEFDKRAWELEREELEAEEALQYARANARPLAQTRAKLKTRASIMGEFGETLGTDYVDSLLEEVDLAPKNHGGNRPQQKPPMNQGFSRNIPERSGHPEQQGISRQSPPEEKTPTEESKEKVGEIEPNFPMPRQSQEKKVESNQ